MVYLKMLKYTSNIENTVYSIDNKAETQSDCKMSDDTLTIHT